MTPDPRAPRLRLRVHFGPGWMLGPGRAELLERIDRCGSIAAAGREMNMSYKRAWQLIEILNTMFHAPLVDSTRGGPGGGGAVLTDTGRQVLRLYQDMHIQAEQACAAQTEALRALLAPGSDMGGQGPKP